MNKKKALSQLILMLSRSGFIIYQKMIDELMSIVGNSGVEDKVFSIFSARLEFLTNHGNHAQICHKEFEHIGEGIYSMHIAVDPLNIRILYAFRDPNTILLLAFYERGGKKHTDYTYKISEARKRLEELLD